MTKHTPGPWKQLANHVYAPGPNGANICSVSEPRATSEVRYVELSIGSKGMDEAYANARLISAAPDLYTALKEIVEHPAAFSDGAKRLWSQALAAIAKAEGRAE